MIPRPDNSRPYNSRLDNLISWFAASVIVTAGVIYGLKLQEDRGKPKPERARACAVADSLGRLEGHFGPQLSRNPERPAVGACRRRGVLFAGSLVSGDRRGRFVLRAVRRRRHHR